MAGFAKNGVKQYVNTRVSAIENDGKIVKALNTTDSTEIVIECDTVVMAVGSKKNVLDVEGVTTPITYAGDCSGERTAGILEAIRGGYHAANEI
jgi:pyruvate/2-oxoglutarate dehydrogenase complex dihydrolipoamide dehydrogenase (E3) component